MDIEYCRKVILKMNKYKIREDIQYGDSYIKVKEE